VQTITLTATVLAGDFIETAIDSTAQTKIIGVQCQDILIGLYRAEQPIGQRKLAISPSAIWLSIPAPDIVFFDDVKTFGRFDAAGSNIGLDKRSRKTNKIRTRVVSTNSKEVLHGFIEDNVVLGATVYTDEHASYKDRAYYGHKWVNHSARQYVKRRHQRSGRGTGPFRDGSIVVNRHSDEGGKQSVVIMGHDTSHPTKRHNG